MEASRKELHSRAANPSPLLQVLVKECSRAHTNHTQHMSALIAALQHGAFDFIHACYAHDCLVVQGRC